VRERQRIPALASERFTAFSHAQTYRGRFPPRVDACADAACVFGCELTPARRWLDGCSVTLTSVSLHVDLCRALQTRATRHIHPCRHFPKATPPPLQTCSQQRPQRAKCGAVSSHSRPVLRAGCQPLHARPRLRPIIPWRMLTCSFDGSANCAIAAVATLTAPLMSHAAPCSFQLFPRRESHPRTSSCVEILDHPAFCVGRHPSRFCRQRA